MNKKVVLFIALMSCGILFLSAQQRERARPVMPPEYLPGQTPRNLNLPGLPPIPAFSQATGSWWTNPAVIAQLGLSNEQRSKLDKVVDQHRMALVDRTAELEKQEAALKPLLAAESLDSGKVMAQVERVIQARGSLERELSAMTFELRQILSAAQWLLLQALGIDPCAVMACK
jgi:Spy/CpxP family protein refolding chaperone